jgi:phosphohistidine phosphatase
VKRLFLLRHAKTEQANKDTPADAERALTERGRAEASVVEREMHKRGYAPDLIWCSPSRRTRQTLELANPELECSAKIEYVPAIYAAGARQLLALFQGLPDTVREPLIVGHNPGFEDCLSLLLKHGGDASDKDKDKFPTGALAVLQFEISVWGKLSPHSGTLVDFIRPKELGVR